MQRLKQLSLEVEQVFADIGQTYAQYQRDRGLFCRSGCGECCLHRGIEATVLEMLPLAYSLLEEGKAESTLDALANHQQDGCFFYQRHSADGKMGQCSVYLKRPGICRLFGAAGYNGREGEVLLSVCKNIKADHPVAYADTLIALESDPPPMIRNGKEQIRQIDYELGGVNFPINEAMRQALEKVLFEQYYAGLAE
ncbi:YkgJ family cysteine cluster protein [Rheinheimera sp. 4Y26]|uniref:YkgJ family cysteine cluster protein n=1 Tax=Rheinheimera sp. 4Y26 TaxID=2977811 RepID=UPI0021B0EF01|nr:YkgJ family cysteine cluster protein [Rheinheimera sp. 4Y26]MCT6699831.1 YkgJ family cysteine cluster protein [Rheinheimera sp. 4Y26]